MPELKLKIAAGTDVGLLRDNNEDNLIVCRNLTSDDWTIPRAGDVTSLGPYGALLVVADGMGGANAGEVASGMAVDTVKEIFSKKRLADVVESEETVIEFMCSVIHDANKNIAKHGKKHKGTHGMGTTIVMVWLLNSKAFVCWCGDSRCYVYNPGLGLTRLTKDHSLVQTLIDAGELTPEDAFNHPMSNVITQCLGNTAHKINPGKRIYHLSHNDVLLLCTDGLCGLCTDNEIVEVMASTDSVDDMKKQLIEEALKAGGHDNITVVVCQIDAPALSLDRFRSNSLSSTLRTVPAEEEIPPTGDDDTSPPAADDDTAQPIEFYATPDDDANEPEEAVPELATADAEGAITADGRQEPMSAAAVTAGEEPEPVVAPSAVAEAVQKHAAAATGDDDTPDDALNRRQQLWLIGVSAFCILLLTAILYAGSPQQLISLLKHYALSLWIHASSLMGSP